MHAKWKRDHQRGQRDNPWSRNRHAAACSSSNCTDHIVMICLLNLSQTPGSRTNTNTRPVLREHLGAPGYRKPQHDMRHDIILLHLHVTQTERASIIAIHQGVCRFCLSVLPTRAQLLVWTVQIWHSDVCDDIHCWLKRISVSFHNGSIPDCR